MKGMTEALAGLVTLVLLFGGLVWAVTVTDDRLGERIEEDSPDWDCRTMGNRTCGMVIGEVTYLVQFDDDGPHVIGKVEP